MRSLRNRQLGSHQLFLVRVQVPQLQPLSFRGNQGFLCFHTPFSARRDTLGDTLASPTSRQRKRPRLTRPATRCCGRVRGRVAPVCHDGRGCGDRDRAGNRILQHIRDTKSLSAARQARSMFSQICATGIEHGVLAFNPARDARHWRCRRRRNRSTPPRNWKPCGCGPVGPGEQLPGCPGSPCVPHQCAASQLGGEPRSRLCASLLAIRLFFLGRMRVHLRRGQGNSQELRSQGFVQSATSTTSSQALEHHGRLQLSRVSD